MGSQFEVILPGGVYPQALEAALAALDAVQDLEKKLSYFLPESEVTLINHLAGVEPVAVSRPVWQVVRESIRLYHETEGAFDITAGPLWRLWGFARKKREVPSDSLIRETLQAVGADKVVLDEKAQTIYLAHPKAEINLGGIGKGFALDQALQVIRGFGIECVLLSGGYSSVLTSVPDDATPEARGDSPSDSPADREVGPACASRVDLEQYLGSWIWEVGIRHPVKPDERVGILRLKRGAIGTSGSALQFFRHEGKRLCHIIDPRTGYPTGDKVLAVTVRAPNATWADALSTAFFILGPDWAQEYCRKNPGVAAIFALTAENARGFVWQMVGDWPEEAISLADWQP